MACRRIDGGSHPTPLVEEAFAQSEGSDAEGTTEIPSNRGQVRSNLNWGNSPEEYYDTLRGLRFRYTDLTGDEVCEITLLLSTLLQRTFR